ncbi:Crp/Fnr family transcriptional regulator [Spirochaeta cellobiosiphila]|uniref:Crp/Fnr family transcriptional regulator n=1 Tax=Spirochaeta cellobiosiphila TaxID=504483 RepID=UPI0004054BA8|nr:Crp/Fnr family transcriptional regulator [Spirochaeta cellobiosiphila]
MIEGPEDIPKTVNRTEAFHRIIPPEEIKYLQGICHSRYIKKNDFFIKQGDTLSPMAIINKGLFRVYCVDYEGNDKTLAFRKEEQFLSGYTPILKNQPIWYSIQALEDSLISYIEFEQYSTLLKKNFCWVELSHHYVIGLFMEKEERERSLLMDDALTRYRNFTQTFPDYTNRISQYHIASYLGITPSSLSRIRANSKNN